MRTEEEIVKSLKERDPTWEIPKQFRRDRIDSTDAYGYAFWGAWGIAEQLSVLIPIATFLLGGWLVLYLLG